jgi:N-carbamoyl-L-amino-acid hydrolase
MRNVANLSIDSERLHQDFEELAKIGATVDGGIRRLALSNEDLEARAWLADQIMDAGLPVRDDDAGNLSGVLLSNDPDAKTLLIGSHLDSVPNGGKYDSSIGILAALECARTIKGAGIELPFHLEIIDFTDEEGAWQSLFGSRALTGTLNKTYTRDGDEDFGPFRAALFRAGIHPIDISKAIRDPKTVAGYLELHIEQGYRLDRDGLDIGVVTGIVGRSTYQVIFYGEASHSGTTAMNERKDALYGAAAFILEANKLVRKQYVEGVFNCGNLTVAPGAFNIIPSEAYLTMECRHADKTILADMENALVKLANEQARKHGLTVSARRSVHMPAAVMSESTIQATEMACEQLGVTHRRMISFAGHDAQILSNFTRTGMIFIPSVGGISHSPREFTEWGHVIKGANILLHTILILAQQHIKR